MALPLPFYHHFLPVLLLPPPLISSEVKGGIASSCPTFFSLMLCHFTAPDHSDFPFVLSTLWFLLSSYPAHLQKGLKHACHHCISCYKLLFFWFLPFLALPILEKYTGFLVLLQTILLLLNHLAINSGYDPSSIWPFIIPFSSPWWSPCQLPMQILSQLLMMHQNQLCSVSLWILICIGLCLTQVPITSSQAMQSSVGGSQTAIMGTGTYHFNLWSDDTIPTRNGRELGEIWVSKVGTNF